VETIRRKHRRKGYGPAVRKAWLKIKVSGGSLDRKKGSKNEDIGIVGEGKRTDKSVQKLGGQRGPFGGHRLAHRAKTRGRRQRDRYRPKDAGGKKFWGGTTGVAKKKILMCAFKGHWS